MGDVVYDTVSNSGELSAASSASWSHTITSNANRGIAVMPSGNSTVWAVTAISYAGVTLPFVGHAQSAGQQQVNIYGDKVSATGANTVSITLDQTAYWGAAAISASNVSQSTVFGTAATDSGTKTTQSITVNGAAGDLAIDTISWDLDSNDWVTTGTGQTERARIQLPAAGDSDAFSTSLLTGSSKVLSWGGTSVEGCVVGAAMKAAGGGATARVPLSRPFPYKPGSPQGLR